MNRARYMIAGLTLVIVSGLAVGFATRASGSSPAPPGLEVTDRGLTATAKPGTFCYSDREGMLCGDAVQDLDPPGELPLRPGGVLTLRSRARATRIAVSLEHADATGTGAVIVHGGRATRMGSRGLRWRFRLPSDLQGVTYLRLSVKYGQRGAATFALGVEVLQPCNWQGPLTRFRDARLPLKPSGWVAVSTGLERRQRRSTGARGAPTLG